MIWLLKQFAAALALLWLGLVALAGFGVVAGLGVAIIPVVHAFLMALWTWPQRSGPELMLVDGARMFGLGLGIAGISSLCLGLLTFRR